MAQSRAMSVYIQIASSSKEWPMAPMVSMAKAAMTCSTGNLLPRDASSVPVQIVKEQVKWVY